MRTVCVRMEAAWGFLGAIVGAFVTQVFNLWLDARRTKAQEAERERDRTHERDLRKLELDDAHRARLYDDRKAAYADFYRRYDEYNSSLRVAMNARDHRQNLRRKAVGDHTADREATEALDQLFEARAALDRSLQLIELAASPAVRDTAGELRELVEKAEALEIFGRRDEANLDKTLVSLVSAYDAVEQGERRLREAIQVELELDR
jgi:hypothetical protein